jgi:hypothetical protein
MNKIVLYATAILILVAGIVLFAFNRGLFRGAEEIPENALVRAEDVSGTAFYVHFQVISGVDYYEPPVSEGISRTKTIYLEGNYGKGENQEMYLTSEVTRYINNPTSDFEYKKQWISNSLGSWQNWQIEEDFIPEFKNSSYYQYRQCAKAISSDKKETYMCVVSSIIRQNYLFTLLLRGNGTITNEDLENMLETALKDRQTILDRLP